MPQPLFVELSAGELACRLEGRVTGVDGNRGLYVTSEGVEGLYGTPDAKVSLAERGQGDGAHDVPETDLLYAARTLTIHYGCAADDRDDALRLLMRVQSFAHRLVRARVVDAGMDTYLDGGYIASKVQPTWRSDSSWSDTLTIVFGRPERLSSLPHRCQLLPASDGRGGLWYGGDAAGLVYPLTYGQAATDARNVGTLVNDGTSRAYPVFTAVGPMPDGVMLEFGDGSGLWLDMNVAGTPVVLDSRLGTASCAGRDVSTSLRRRGWPVVAPGGSLNVTLQSPGTGYVDCLVHDTYM